MTSLNSTYREAVAYIEGIPKFTTKNKLDHTKECLRRLGNPQEAFRVIHVAGTNGKGSVCAFLTAALQAAGYRCGMFTSPHLVRVNERFQIDGKMITDETFVQAFRRVKELADTLVAEGDFHPTYFEFLFLMGMLIFAGAGVEFVMLETGLGGRLDATNAIAEPLLCVITSISRDHVQYLGDTIEKIAGEKAGIIKPGVPVIYDGNNPAAAQVICEKAKAMGSPALAVTEEVCRLLENTTKGLRFTVENSYYSGMEFFIPFAADYQMRNGALALTAAALLAKKLALPREAVQRGMAGTLWQGRMETILPGVIVDGAHNEDGVQSFIETACHFQKEYRITLLFAAVSDKEYPDMIQKICRALTPAHVVTAQLLDERTVACETLGDLFRKQGCEDVRAFARVPEAFEAARALQGDGLLFCVGSLYLVGEIKEYLESV